MSVAVSKRLNVTATGFTAPFACGHPGPEGRSFASLHAFSVTNNDSSSATVRPQGSLAETHDPRSAAWADLGSGTTAIAAGATAIITVADTPLARVRLNVSVLAGNSLDIIYLGIV